MDALGRPRCKLSSAQCALRLAARGCSAGWLQGSSKARPRRQDAPMTFSGWNRETARSRIPSSHAPPDDAPSIDDSGHSASNHAALSSEPRIINGRRCPRSNGCGCVRDYSACSTTLERGAWDPMSVDNVTGLTTYDMCYQLGCAAEVSFLIAAERPPPLNFLDSQLPPNSTPTPQTLEPRPHALDPHTLIRL